MSKSDKMYNKSPTINKDADGKPTKGISKPTQADAVDMGVAGDNAAGDPSEMPVDVKNMDDMNMRHATELKDMHSRHEKELHDTHKRHLKEATKSEDKKEGSE